MLNNIIIYYLFMMLLYCVFSLPPQSIHDMHHQEWDHDDDDCTRAFPGEGNNNLIFICFDFVSLHCLFDAKPHIIIFIDIGAKTEQRKITPHGIKLAFAFL